MSFASGQKRKRGGKLGKVQAHIQQCLEDGSFDGPAFLQWLEHGHGWYKTPGSEDRKNFSENYLDELERGNAAQCESMLYTSDGYNFVIWSRNIRFCADQRFEEFARLKAA